MGDDFYAARIRDEREARAVQSGEVTLAEIYARPCLAQMCIRDRCILGGLWPWVRPLSIIKEVAVPDEQRT